MIGESEMNKIRKFKTVTQDEYRRLLEHRAQLRSELSAFVQDVPAFTQNLISDIDKLRAELEPHIPTVYPVDDPRACKGEFHGTRITR